MKVCQLIIEIVDEKNPSDNHGQTPLHHAARYGFFNICQLIIENVDEKNPSDNDGDTPLHHAAERGFLNIYQLIAENIKDINPTNGSGDTPLSLAAKGGHFDICKFIVENVTEKNPAHNLRISTNLAKDKRYFNCVKFIVRNVKDKHFSDYNGKLELLLEADNKCRDEYSCCGQIFIPLSLELFDFDQNPLTMIYVSRMSLAISTKLFQPSRLSVLTASVSASCPTFEFPIPAGV